MPSAGSLLPEIPDEDAYARVHGDPAPWLPAMEAICARHGIDGADLYCERTGTNVVFRAGLGPWLKLFPPMWREDFVRERTGLAAAAGVAGLSVPQLLHDGELEDWPYVVLSHVEGEQIETVWGGLGRDAQVGLARQLGRLLRALHGVDVAACGPITEDWPAWVQTQIEECVSRQAGYGLDPAWVRELEAFVAALPPMIVSGDPPVFLHADVTDHAVFVQETDGGWQVTGLIDFGDAMVGNRLYEFAAPLVFLMQGRRAAQRAMLEGYGWEPDDLDLDESRRMVAWCLLHRWGRIPTYARITPGRKPASLSELIEALWTVRGDCR